MKFKWKCLTVEFHSKNINHVFWSTQNIGIIHVWYFWFPGRIPESCYLIHLTFHFGSARSSPLLKVLYNVNRLVSQCSLWSLWNDSERCDHRQFHIKCYLVLLEDTLWCRNLLPTYSIGSLSLIARLKLKVSRLTFDAVCHEKLLSRLEMYCFVLSSPNGSERFCADVWIQLLASACCPERSAPIRASRYPFVSGRC